MNNNSISPTSLKGSLLQNLPWWALTGVTNKYKQRRCKKESSVWIAFLPIRWLERKIDWPRRRCHKAKETKYCLLPHTCCHHSRYHFFLVLDWWIVDTTLAMKRLNYSSFNYWNSPNESMIPLPERMYESLQYQRNFDRALCFWIGCCIHSTEVEKRRTSAFLLVPVRSLSTSTSTK